MKVSVADIHYPVIVDCVEMEPVRTERLVPDPAHFKHEGGNP